MGIETNPTKVDDLNSAWPASNEPAREGFAHLQNIKRAVQGRANTAGQYGVTTLSSETDSDAEDRAATPKAISVLRGEIAESIETLNTLAEQLEAAFEGIDTSVPDGGLLPQQLWQAAVGTTNSWVSRPIVIPTDFIGEDPNQNFSGYRNWTTLLGFRCLNGGSAEIWRRVGRSITGTSGQLETRILVNGSVALFQTTENRTALQALFGNDAAGFTTFTDTLSVSPGDIVEFQFRVGMLDGSFSLNSFRLAEFRIRTTQSRPLIINPFSTSDAHTLKRFFTAV